MIPSLYSTYLLGCTDPDAINYNPSATIDDDSCVYDCTFPQNWTYTNTGANQTFIIPADLTINDNIIPNGSALGVFFMNDAGESQCAGYTLLNGQINSFAVMANDTNSPETDGLLEGAEIQWVLWNSELCEVQLVDASYLEEEVVFTINGLSFIETLEEFTCQEINLPEGWYIYSSYIQMETMDMVEVFEPVVDALKIIKNSDGETYLPEWNYNDIGDLQVDEAYHIKTNYTPSLWSSNSARVNTYKFRDRLEPDSLFKNSTCKCNYSVDRVKCRR